MVKGIEKFRDHFTAFQDRYVLIGGTASTLAMEELGAAFRATKDLDIVLCVEALDKEFTRQFWAFIHEGGYENRQKSTGKRLFYRFSSPKKSTFPEMLELFSRVPDALQLAEGSHLTPIPVADEVSSLSAILLHEDYYTFIHSQKRVVNDLTIIGAECLIPLKARAFTDLSQRKATGEKVDSRTIKKHKNDIFRIYTILDTSSKIKITDGIRNDLRKAFEMLRNEACDLKSLGITGTSVEAVLAEMESFYGIEGAPPETNPEIGNSQE